jgi:hypothetical protein
MSPSTVFAESLSFLSRHATLKAAQRTIHASGGPMQPHRTIRQMLASLSLAVALCAWGAFVGDTYFQDQINERVVTW